MKVNKLFLAVLSAVCVAAAPLSLTACSPATEQKFARVAVLLGQSNMEGTSYKSLLKSSGVSEEKYSKYAAGYDDVKICYTTPRNPSQSSANQFIPTALGQGGQPKFFGPEVGIAEYLSDNGYSQVVLVKYSYSGTSLVTDWRSPSSGWQTGACYTGAVEYVLGAMQVLQDSGYTPVIDAICWMQGESDADKTQGVADLYYGLQKNFIKDLRKDLSAYQNTEGIGFIDAGISDCELWKFQKTVNDAKYKIAQSDELNTYFSTIDEKLEYSNEPYDNPDVAHFDCLSEIYLDRKP